MARQQQATGFLRRRPSVRTRDRRGVLILVILSLLILFVVIAVTFVLVATRHRQAAITIGRFDRTGDNPVELTESAARDLFRGSLNPRSPLNGDNLLVDMYGVAVAKNDLPLPGEVNTLLYGALKGQVSGVSQNLAGGLIDLQLVTLANDPRYRIPLDNRVSVYNGCVLTLVNGPAKGLSTYILESNGSANIDDPMKMVTPGPRSASVRIAPLKDSYGQVVRPRLGDEFIINGRPFSGTGAGFNPVTGQLDALDTSAALSPLNAPYALLPNTASFPAYYAPLGFPTDRPQPFYYDFSGPGGANEDYDAPDYQNPFLAWIQTNANAQIVGTASRSGTGNPSEPFLGIKPSFHDPALLAYWNARVNSSGQPQDGLFADPATMSPQARATNAALLRRIMFRPNHIDHPNFTASTNPGLTAALLGQMPPPQQPGSPPGPPQFMPPALNSVPPPAQWGWDVDNDGDGVADSVWMDLGYPTQTTRDGRVYKPLFAFLVLDMDGRLNVNAHGSLDEIQNFNPPSRPPYAGQFDPSSNPPLIRGLGVGPAEIRFGSVMRAPGEIVAPLQGLPGGTQPLEGRYGSDYDTSVPGMPQPGRRNTDDWQNLLQMYQYPRTYPDPLPTARIGGFMSPPDLRGRLSVALDPLGQPLFTNQGFASWQGSGWANQSVEAIDDPYEINLSRDAPRGLPTRRRTDPVDNPFSAAELERLLRPFDGDAQNLPDRLTRLIRGNVGPNPNSQDPSLASRNLLTTDSFDLPLPSLIAPGGIPSQAGGAFGLRSPTVSIFGVPYRAQSFNDLVSAKVTNFQPNEFNDLLGQFSHDLLAGRRMNLNRPFGNGSDDNNNGLVDETVELGLNQPLTYPTIAGSNFPSTVTLNLANANAGPTPQSQRSARYILARQLYLLLMLFADPGYSFPYTEQGVASPGGQAPTPQARELTVRRLAQWAVNAVDFMDPDNAMTAFEYDVNPWDGWNVDGDLLTDDTNHLPTARPADRRVVWGCESPLLLLTETLAFHDRRVRDSQHDRGPGKKRDAAQNPDPTLDQPFIPRGAAFFELYATFSPTTAMASRDLFEFVPNASLPHGGSWRLDLARMAPADARGAHPVWRLAISQSVKSDPNNNVLQHLGLDPTMPPAPPAPLPKPDSTSLQPEQMPEPYPVPRNKGDWTLFRLAPGAPVPDVKLERIVWLSNTAPPVDEQPFTYWADVPFAQVGGGEYVVVGPGGAGNGGLRTNTTVLGIPVGGDDTTPGAPSKQHIRLTPTVEVTEASGTPHPASSPAKPAVGIPVAARKPGGVTPWTGAARIGISISEPLVDDNYYTEPTDLNPGTDLVEAYGDITEADANKKFPDQPFDSDPAKNRPLFKDQMLGTGTYTNVKTVFLQRLADPTLPWDPIVNPYLTVDWMPIDLTVFNGEDREPQNFSQPPWDPDDPTPNTAPNIVRFGTRQRGGSLANYDRNGPPPNAASPNTNYNVWAPTSVDPEKTDESAAATNYFRHELGHNTVSANALEKGQSLGRLNYTYGESLGSTPPEINFRGAPMQPFPWIQWNNRPYANPFELIQVPAADSARLCLEFSPRQTDEFSNNSAQQDGRSVFAHLLNFFHSSQPDGNLPTPIDPKFSTAKGAANFFRIFEFLNVPSPYVGTETILDPAVFSNTTLPGTENLHPPFNTISNFRDPGRLNINTVSNPRLWDQGVMQRPASNTPSIRSVPSYDQLVDSRRGATSGGAAAAFTIDSTKPSIVNNPFRSASSADLVPPAAGNVNAFKHRPVDVTLLRADPSGNGPLFVGQPGGIQPAAVDPFRNSGLRYQNLQRIHNLVTTRSNVFAVWVTVGFFELEPNVPTTPGGSVVDAGHPDGYRLSAEIGSDTGEIVRHRGFFLFDRSIPVAFERGVNHNIDKAILIKRFIE